MSKRSIVKVRGSALSRTITAVFVLAMALLVGWLASNDGVRFSFCAALLAAMTLALVAVKPGRYWLYAIGVVVGVATLTLAVWPTDPSSESYCGSVLNPSDAEDAYDLGEDPSAYFRACDENAATFGMLVIAGSAATGLLIGLSVQPVGSRRRTAPLSASELRDAAL